MDTGLKLKAVPLFNGVIVKPRSQDSIVQVKGMKVVGANPNIKRRIITADVVHIGPGLFSDNYSRLECTVLEGDVVVYEETACLPIMIEGEDLGLLPENKILLILEDKDGNSAYERLDRIRKKYDSLQSDPSAK